jgi:hypothetical protein
MPPFKQALPVRASLTLLAAVSLLTAVGCSSGSPQNLRGPAPEVGQVYHDEVTITMAKGKITATDGRVTETGEMDLTLRGVYEDEILGVSDGRVTKSRSKVVTEEDKGTIRADGQTYPFSHHTPLEGETVQCERIGEKWHNTLVGKAPNEKQVFDVETFPPPQSGVDWYPADPVKPGHSWSTDIAQLRSLFGSHMQIDSGSWKQKFEKMVVVDGEPCAQIAQEIDVRGKMRDEHGEYVQVSLKLTGTSQRSLKRGFDVSSKMTGTVSASGKATEGGVRLEVSVNGPVTMEGKSHRK